MSPHATRSHDLLATTLATWICQLARRGVPPEDPALAALCEAVDAAADPEAGESAARRLVAAVASSVAGPEPHEVARWATSVFGARASIGFGAPAEREERAHVVRKYQFGRGLPWLARIWERQGTAVRPGWLIVDRMTDEITAADPDPWNEIEEERRIPLSDFLVLWELAENASVHVT